MITSESEPIWISTNLACKKTHLNTLCTIFLIVERFTTAARVHRAVWTLMQHWTSTWMYGHMSLRAPEKTRDDIVLVSRTSRFINHLLQLVTGPDNSESCTVTYGQSSKYCNGVPFIVRRINVGYRRLNIVPSQLIIVFWHCRMWTIVNCTASLPLNWSLSHVDYRRLHSVLPSQLFTDHRPLRLRVPPSVNPAVSRLLSF